MRKRKLIGAAILAVLVGAAFLFWPQPEPQVLGTLRPDDVAQITRMVRAQVSERQMDERSGLLSFFWARSLRWNLRKLQATMRWSSERILSIEVDTNGTVEVSTEIVPSQSGRYFKLRIGPKGWEIMERGEWHTRAAAPPDKSMQPTATPAVTDMGIAPVLARGVRVYIDPQFQVELA
jgi:hypothetical protein